MKKFYVFLMIIFVLGSIQINADDLDEKKFKITFSWQREQASSWYEHDNDSIHSLRTDWDVISRIDSSKVDANNNVIYDTTFTKYTADNYRNTLRINFDWRPVKYLHLGATLPVSLYKEYERFEQGAYYDQTYGETRFTGGEERDMHTYNKIDYLGFNARSFVFNNAKFKLGALASVNIPFGSDKSSFISEDHPLLSDGFFEFKSGLFTSIQAKNIRIATEVIYDYRAEDMSDMFLFNTQFGLTSVKNTELQANIYYGYALESYDSAKIFDPRQEVMWSNFLDIGFNFKFIFLENFEFNGGYRVSVWGENGWNYGIFTGTMSYYF